MRTFQQCSFEFAIVLWLLQNKFKFVEFPVRIEDRKYDRNSFMFSLVMIVDTSIKCGAYVHERIVAKLPKYFEMLELIMGEVDEELLRAIGSVNIRIYRCLLIIPIDCIAIFTSAIC
jgi:hypothetical protein